jgi:hypothetical protein
MAASANDKARKSYSYLQKTLNANIDASVTALTPNNVTSIPTDTGVSFVIDRVDSAGNKTPALRELMTGVVSGGTISGLLRGEQSTTAQPHLANAVIEFVNSGEMWNDLIDFLLQDHSNPNGNHKTLTDDNSNEWLERGSVASAVNQVKVTNAITGKNPKVSASGDDTNIQLDLDGKGTGYAVARNPELTYDFVVPATGVWSGLSYGATLTAAMTAATCYINGRRIVIAAIATRTFTASKDTYIDILDNLDGTGTVVYTEVANNAASPALASNSLRIGIIVTGATIAAVGSVNQGEENKVLPIASSVPYAVTDSLGNLICPRDPNRKLIGSRYTTTQFTTASGTDVQVTGVQVPINLATARKVKISCNANYFNSNVGATNATMSVIDGTVGVGSSVLTSTLQNNGAGQGNTQTPFKIITLTAGFHNLSLALRSAASTAVINGDIGVTVELY